MNITGTNNEHKEWVAFRFKKDLNFPMFSFKAGDTWMGSKKSYPFDTAECVNFGKGTLYFKDLEILYSGSDKARASKLGWG
jgi:hypothetical protein